METGYNIFQVHQPVIWQSDWFRVGGITRMKAVFCLAALLNWINQQLWAGKEIKIQI
jgi:hypothetical protein